MPEIEAEEDESDDFFIIGNRNKSKGKSHLLAQFNFSY